MEKNGVNRASRSFLDLIVAKPRLAAHVKELYIPPPFHVFDVISRCPDLRHVAFHSDLSYLADHTLDRDEPGVTGMNTLKMREESALRTLCQSRLHSLCVTLESFVALLRASDADSPWTHTITHVEVSIWDLVPSPEVPPMALLRNLTHFAVVYKPRTSQTIVDIAFVILNSAPSLFLLVIVVRYPFPYMPQELRKWSETQRDNRVVILSESHINYLGTSHRALGWESQIDSSPWSIWGQAEDLKRR